MAWDKKLIWDRKDRGVAFYFLGVPIIIFLIIVNIVLITWFVHLLYYMFTDTPETMSLLEWAEHLYVQVKHLFD